MEISKNFKTLNSIKIVSIIQSHIKTMMDISTPLAISSSLPSFNLFYINLSLSTLCSVDEDEDSKK